MNWIVFEVGLATGLILGFAGALVFGLARSHASDRMADDLLRRRDEERRSDIDLITQHLKAAFGDLSLEALSRSSAELIKLGKERIEAERHVTVQELESRKGLIDQQLSKMSAELDGLGKLVQSLEKDRAEKFGELTKHLQMAGEQTASLLQTTGLLKEALAGSKSRGQWGERMAEDILRAAGFVENVNYLVQKTIEGIGSRPDFTFLLPRDLKLNMDVKFPFDNYVRFLDASSDAERNRFRLDFIRDVRLKIKEVTTREYINREQNTVDYVLLFIANEQVFAFIHEHDNRIVEEGMKQHVICCSPATLFAVLAVIRQAVDSFSVEQTSNEILSLLGAFKRQWDEFLRKLESLGKRIDDLHKDFEILNTTRRRQLERPLRRMEEIRTDRGLSTVSDDSVVGVPDTN
jgi:DNA recombination protein RmuC